jgi:hypothetical protein
VLDQSYVWPPEPLEPRKAFHERAWRLVGPSKRVPCARSSVWRPGLRCRRGNDREDSVRTQLTRSVVQARLLAAQWREAALALGSFLELDVDACKQPASISGRRLGAPLRAQLVQNAESEATCIRNDVPA